MLVFLRSFFEERIAAGEAFSYSEYEEHASGCLNWPSGPSIRNQLGESIGSWAAIFEAARALHDDQVADNMLWNLTNDLEDPLHGDRIAYDAGCRCPACDPSGALAQKARAEAAKDRAVARESAAERRRRESELLAGDPADPRHGTMTGYLGGCRCQRCMAAQRVDWYRRQGAGRKVL